jgi:1-deoxy-D-xylulose-5-phosphate reductoisomerase
VKRKKKIVILGSTGSIGSQSLEVISKNAGNFELSAIVAGSNVSLLVEQALKYNPEHAVIYNTAGYKKLSEALAGTGIKIMAGPDAIKEVVSLPDVDLVMAAMVGFAGLEPVIAAVKAGNDIALANKETLVVAGELITSLAKKHKVRIIPVDSEHSAIFQCLMGEDHASVEKLILTASGGPFRGMKTDQLEKVTVRDALTHPNWCMGIKVTIDSATLMNKGLEVIEARWLLTSLPQILKFVVHPQSVIHSLVQFHDGPSKRSLGCRI